MLQSLKDAYGVIVGSAAGLATALLGLAGAVVGTFIDPVAGAVASAALLVALVAVFVFALRQRALFTGPYRVLEETITWEFADPQGHAAILTKQQEVRFNYLAIALIELASGDGDLFADFSCGYGSVIKGDGVPSADEKGVLTFADEKGVLILLDPRRTRDEVATLKSTRTVQDGFTEPQQWIAHRSVVPSEKTELILQFPSNHDVKNVRIAGPKGHGDRPAKGSELKKEGSRQVLRLKSRAYRENQMVKVTWHW
ncbi:MAG TPA: hypothetical protein VGO66_06055 [Solirubrobacterales bacterium]|jgi:hypothetical protein|nr:hypothetical protein [Solirubrobacterales bacterium]